MRKSAAVGVDREKEKSSPARHNIALPLRNFALTLLTIEACEGDEERERNGHDGGRDGGKREGRSGENGEG